VKNQEIQADNKNDFKIEDLGKINTEDSRGCIFSDALKKI